MIRKALLTDVPALVSNWQMCFGDEPSQIKPFFESKAFSPADTLVYEENGEVVSQLFLMEGVLRKGCLVYPAFYLYAACTLEEYRGRGIMSALVKEAIAHARERGKEFIFLLPGEKELYDYYSKLGFEPCCACEEKVINKGEAFSPDYRLAPVFCSEVCRSLGVLFAESFGYNAECQGEYGTALYEKDGGTLVITDIEISGKTGEYISYLLDKTDCGQAKVILPAEKGKPLPHGMAIACGNTPLPENIFLNFTLD